MINIMDCKNGIERTRIFSNDHVWLNYPDTKAIVVFARLRLRVL